jgi:Resolvase, N terminal domain
MTDPSKVKLSHTQRAAYVYIRQSTPGQVEHNRESTARQYALAEKACQLGWPKEQVVIVDDDLGLSGSSTDKRSGFARLTSEVALAHVGIVLGLEVSRLARNNVDWYRLLELCGITDTLIGDNDGLYHPALFNDRLLLGLKGTLATAGRSSRPRQRFPYWPSLAPMPACSFPARRLPPSTATPLPGFLYHASPPSIRSLRWTPSELHSYSRPGRPAPSVAGSSAACRVMSRASYSPLPSTPCGDRSGLRHLRDYYALC